MAITWCYTCEDIDHTFDGTQDYPSGFNTATAFTHSVTSWTINSSFFLGGSNALEKPAISFGENLSFDATSYYDIDGEGAFGFGFYFETGEYGAVELARLIDVGTNDYIDIMTQDTDGAGTVRLRFRNTVQGRLTVASIGATLSSANWYYLVFRWDTPNEAWGIEIYDDTGTLIDSDSATGDSSNFNAWPASTCTDLLLGDAGGDQATRYYDNVILGDAYTDPLEDHYSIDSYSDIAGGGAITVGGTSQLAIFSSTGDLNAFTINTIGASSQLNSLASTGSLNTYTIFTIGASSQLGSFNSSGQLIVGDAIVVGGISQLGGFTSLGGLNTYTQLTVGAASALSVLTSSGGLLVNATHTLGATSQISLLSSSGGLSVQGAATLETLQALIDELYIRMDMNILYPNTYNNDGSVITNSLFTLTKIDNGDGTFTVVKS